MVFLAVSPGHVQTDMGNASGRTVRSLQNAKYHALKEIIQLSCVACQAPLSVEHVAERIVKLAGEATKDMTGQFLDFDGHPIPY